MARTAQHEEQQWLTARWLNEQSKPAHDARGSTSRSDRPSQPIDGANDTICNPTLEKLYAAQRKQKEDLKRQIEDAMAQTPE